MHTNSITKHSSGGGAHIIVFSSTTITIYVETNN